MKKLILIAIKVVLLVGVALAFILAACWFLGLIFPSDSDLALIFSTLFGVMVGSVVGPLLANELLFK
jgi:hypothetical protein